MPKIICAKCQCQMQTSTTGVTVIETAAFGPYKVWQADMLTCPGCGMDVVSGFAERPLMEHYEPGFADWLKHIEATAPCIVHSYEEPQVPPDEIVFRQLWAT